MLVWWGRLRHDDVPEARARAIVERLHTGRPGLVALHGAYASTPFRALMGQPCEPCSWREDGTPERVAVMAPDYPIARGLGPFTIPQTVMSAVPPPEIVVLVSTWDSGETIRSGLTWTVGQDRVVYFDPGHDAFPVSFHPAVHQILANAALWTAKRAC